MTVTSNTAIRQTPAAGAPRTTSSAQPAKFDAGSFSRAADSAKSAPVEQQNKDQYLFQRAPGPVIRKRELNAALIKQGERARATEQLKFLESVYRQRMKPGQPINFSAFGKPAALSVGEGASLVLRSSVSPDPRVPQGTIRFQNGKIDYAYLNSGALMTPKQQATMVSAAYEKVASGLLNKH